MAGFNPFDALVQDTLSSPDVSEAATPVQGVGGGLADFVPASIDGEAPAALSEGEFVWPADVVSFVGNGSSDAGARVLNSLASEIRSMMKQGGSKQSSPLSELIQKAVKKG